MPTAFNFSVWHVFSAWNPVVELFLDALSNWIVIGEGAKMAYPIKKIPMRAFVLPMTRQELLAHGLAWLSGPFCTFCRGRGASYAFEISVGRGLLIPSLNNMNLTALVRLLWGSIIIDIMKPMGRSWVSQAELLPIGWFQRTHIIVLSAFCISMSVGVSACSRKLFIVSMVDLSVLGL